MICTTQDFHMKSLLRSLDILWIVTLNNKIQVYSDYDRPGENEVPWLRLKKYCHENNLFIIKIELLMFGCSKVIMAEDESGLDGVFILRGASKDYDIEAGDGTSYRNLIVGVLNDKEDIINITKYTWPIDSLTKETRLITQENSELMLFKNGSEKASRQVLHFAIDGSGV